MKKIILFILFMGIVHILNAQEQEEWVPTKHLTGYLSLEGEYINGLDALDENFGIGVGEAGILFNYNPLEKMEIRSTFVYRPGQHLDLSIVEISANYKFTDAFAVRAGRIATFVSPTNYNMYAPMNIGVLLPMQLTHKVFYPESVDGIDFNGKFDVGQNSVLKYHIFGGGYFDINHLPIGVLQFHGKEEAFLEQHEEGEHEHTIEQFDTESRTFHYHYCAAGRLSIDAGNFLTVGLSSFVGKHTIETHEHDEEVGTTGGHAEHQTGIKRSFGGDININIGDLTLKGEYWTSSILPDDSNHETVSFNGSYAELSYSFGKVTPYLKYEYLKTIHEGLEIKRPTIGINYRPIFEIMFKFEYHRYATTPLEFDDIVFSLVYSF